jgi:molybdate transport system substrate-binding protein
MIRRRFVAALAALIALAAAVPASAATVTVLAAASLKNAVDEVAKAYQAKTGDTVVASYAASSALARQIEQGAPADVFLSADVRWMDYLAERKLIVAASRRNLLSNRLALIAPADSKATIRIAKGMPLAKALGDGRLAVAGPEVPAGKYAKTSLENLGVWSSVQGKLAQADSVRGALQFVSRGEAPFGIVYDTDAKIDPKVKIVGLFPDHSHPPIIYPGATLASSRNPAGGAFLSFLSTPQATAIFRKYGFIVLPRR